MIAKLRLSPREMNPGRYVAATLRDVKRIREELENQTETAFEEYDRMKRATYQAIHSIILD
jgi:hypothetical protein